MVAAGSVWGPGAATLRGGRGGRVEAMTTQAAIARASDSGQPIRVHTRDGEVLVARVLHCDDRQLHSVVVTSSRPERYGVCDATGFSLRLDAIERVQLLREPISR